jgi:hypothetical protein
MLETQYELELSRTPSSLYASPGRAPQTKSPPLYILAATAPLITDLCRAVPSSFHRAGPCLSGALSLVELINDAHHATNSIRSHWLSPPHPHGVHSHSPLPFPHAIPYFSWFPLMCFTSLEELLNSVYSST